VRHLDPVVDAPSPRVERVLPVVRTAILQREMLVADYDGHPVTIWPYALGWRRDGLCLLGVWCRNDPRAQPLTLAWLPLQDLSRLVNARGYWVEPGCQVQAWLDSAEALDTVGTRHLAGRGASMAPGSPAGAGPWGRHDG
jgi:hypothetical protein